MPLVNVMVNGRAYTIACVVGVVGLLWVLAATVDAKAREVLSSVGQVGDARVILMAALLIADENHAAQARLAAAPSDPVAAPDTGAADALAAEALEVAAAKIEALAGSLVH